MKPARAGREIKRIVVAYEAGRDGFWLARWLRARDVEAYVIYPTSIAASREHRRAKTDRLARYAGLTGSPDESVKRQRERGLARAGSARVRCSMIQFAWRFLRFQKNSALARWFAARTTDRRANTRKTMIVALARKLLIALWRLATRGEVPQGVILRPAS